MHACPTISIVTPSYNQGDFIGETIESILDQSYPNKELIIVDGGSRDQTVEVIRRYERHIAYWVSEPDRGQADAIVKGMRHTQGEIVNWINSDDLLLPGALERIALAFDDADAVVAPVVDFISSGEERVRMNRGLTARGLIEWRRSTRYHQPGIWLRGDYLRGDLDNLIPCDLRYAFDLELFIRYFHRYARIVSLDEPVARFRLHDESKTVKEASGFEKEVRRVMARIAGDPEFSDMAPVCVRRLARLDFRQRLGELEARAQDSAVTMGEMWALIRLHPPSVFRGNLFRRVLALIGGFRQSAG